MSTRSYRKAGRQLFVVVITLLCLAISCERPSQYPAEDITGMAQVRDADSLTIDTVEIRLWAIDAVELNQTCLKATIPWHCGQEAKQALTDQLKGTQLRCTPKDTDRYGRIVAECFAGKVNVNAWLVQSGWALAYRRYSRKFVDDENAAQAHRRGIWQSQFISPWEWRHENH